MPKAIGKAASLAGASEGADFFSLQVTEARRFFLDLKPDGKEPLNVVSAGREQTRPDYDLKREKFPYLCMEFVAGGSGTIRMEGVESRLNPGTIFAYGPSVPHEMSSNPSNPLVKYFVDFTCADLQRFMPAPTPLPGQVASTSTPERILQLYEDLLDAGLRKSRFQQRVCRSIVEQLLLRIAESVVPLGSIGSEAFDTYRQCRQLIEKQYMQLTSLPQLAAACDVDPAYVCRLFKRFDHQSPWQYIMELKMREAAVRLEKPGMLVKNVARELGYADAFQFSRTFRRVFNVSPRKFLGLHRLQ